MQKYCITILLSFTLLFITSYELAGQPKSETVNKEIIKDLKISATDVFSVIGEKATIHITGWMNNYIRMKITFSATHTDNKVASREIEIMKYSLSRDHHTIELRNAFILPPSQDYIESKLDVIIELMVPSTNELSLKNKYGSIDISKMTGKVTTKLEFSDMTLNNVNGAFVLQSAYSEIRGYDVAFASFTCDDEKSQIFMDLSNGVYKFNSKHSDLDLAVKDIRSLTVSSSRTNISIRPDHFESFNYKLLNKEGKIYTSAQYSDQVKQEGKENSLLMTSAPAKPLIQITTTFNTITIK